MRNRLLFLTILLLAPLPLAGQADKPATPAQPSPEVRAAELRAELSKVTYTAKRTIPASDNIFVENGAVIEAIYQLERDQHEVAVPARQTAPVSKVLLLDRAIQVFFASDKCALLIVAKENQHTVDMTAAQLLTLAREGIGALFTAKPADERTGQRKTT